MGTTDRPDGNLIAGERLRLDLLRKLSRRPPLYSGSDRSFWTDSYVSDHVLEAHLDPHTDDASRRPRHISATVDMILRHYGRTDELAGRDATRPRLLDIACGPGLYAEQFAARGFEVTGIDYADVSINYAREQARKQGLAINYIQADLTDVDLEGPYDVITFIYGEFCTLTERQRNSLLKRALLALRPGGLMVFDVFTEAYVRRNRTCDEWHVTLKDGFWHDKPHLVLLQHFHYPSDSASVARYTLVEESGDYRQFSVWWRHFTAAGIRKMLEKAGFTVEALYGSLWGDAFDSRSEWIGVYARRPS